MTRLTRKEVKFEWNDLCEKALQELKMMLTLAPILIGLDRGTHYIVMPPKTNWDVFLCSPGGLWLMVLNS